MVGDFEMKKLLYTLILGTLVSCFALSTSALAAPGPLGGPAPTTHAALVSADYLDYSEYEDASSRQLWSWLAEAEAQKKLYELQERELHEQVKLLEGPGAYYYYGSSDAYDRLLELKSEEYELRIEKEKCEWEKRKLESYLKLIGEKLGKAEIQYALYNGDLDSSGMDCEELYSERYTLQLEEQRLEMEKKELEYEYQMGKLSDRSFVSKFASIFRQKERVKMQREQIDVELEMITGVRGPGALPHILP